MLDGSISQNSQRMFLGIDMHRTYHLFDVAPNRELVQRARSAGESTVAAAVAAAALRGPWRRSRPGPSQPIAIIGRPAAIEADPQALVRGGPNRGPGWQRVAIPVKLLPEQ